MDFKFKDSMLLRIAISMTLAGYSIHSYGTTITVDAAQSVTNGKDVVVSSFQNIYTINGDTTKNYSNKNLFFSFTQFDVSQVDTAKFTCNPCDLISSPVDNVISRVLGGVGYTPTINGTLQSSISNATFWFLSPNGVIFGPQSVINVPAGLHISTANTFTDSGNNPHDVRTDDLSSLQISSTGTFGFVGGNVELQGVTVNNATNNIDISGSKLIVSGGVNTVPNASTFNSDVEIQSGATLNGHISSTNATLSNAGTIAGSASAATTLSNTGTIGAGATAGTDLANTAGKITGTAIAGQNLINSAEITGDATATAGTLTNNALAKIGGNATAGTDLTNDGTITGNAIAKTTLTNAGAISGSAEAMQGNLTNTGTIGTVGANSTAKAGSDLFNNAGTITGDATAIAGQLVNQAMITGNATAATDLTNSAQITGNATATAGALANNVGATIGGNAQATASGLTNAGTITGSASGGTTLTNTGTIGAGATAGSDLFNNAGTITGDATATAGQLINKATITGSAESTQGNLTNTGTIGTAGANSTATAGTNLINDGTITGNVTAGNDLISHGTIQTDGDLTLSANKIQVIGDINYATVISGQNMTISAKELYLKNSNLDSAGKITFDSNKPLIITAGGNATFISKGDFGSDSDVNYILPTSGQSSYGNVFGSTNAKSFASEDNIQAIKNNPLNLTINGKNVSINIPQGSNAFLNLTESNQSQAIQANAVTVLTKPLELPVIPPDPCGAGSSLELKNSSGVIPFLADFLSFSVFPSSQYVKNTQHESEATLLAMNDTAKAKAGSCGKG